MNCVAESAQEPGGNHTPNLVVVQDERHVTEKCFYGAECLHDFLHWIFSLDARRSKTFIAHYFQGYDAVALIGALLKNKITPDIILRGQKCILLLIKQIKCRFIDSYSFMGQSLASLPKSLGIEEQAEKGYFGICFDKTGWQHLV